MYFSKTVINMKKEKNGNCLYRNLFLRFALQILFFREKFLNSQIIEAFIFKEFNDRNC